MRPTERRPIEPGFPGVFPPWLPRTLSAATALYAVVLVFATHYPKPQDFLGARPPNDKLLHFVAYGVLGLLAAATLAVHGRLARRSAGLLLLGLAAAAIVDEVTQPLFRRAAEPLDWVCDVIGLTAGIGIILAMNAWRTKALGR